MKMALHRTIEILLVDDNIGDVVLAREALSGASFQNRVSTARDGFAITGDGALTIEAIDDVELVMVDSA